MGDPYPEDDRERYLLVLERYMHQKGVDTQAPEFFAQGANNLLYLLNYRGRTVVAKVGINPFYRQLHIENEVLRHIVKTGPEVVDFFIDEEDGTQVLLIEYIEGTHPFALSEEQLVNFGSLIGGYHGYEQRVPMVPVETYREFLANRILAVTETGDNYEYYSRFHHLSTQAITLSEAMGEKLVASRVVLVHGDLIPGNIIVDRFGFLRIIDWEGVRYDAPEADIATLVKAFYLDEKEIALFEKGYGMPVDETMLYFRLAVHYLQVIAWRMAIQLPREKDGRNTAVKAELEEELTTAAEMTAKLKEG